MTTGPAGGRTRARVRTIFLGSGGFAVPMLDAVAAHPRLDVVGVVTAPDRPAGRSATPTPTPVAVRARELGFPLLQPIRLRDPESISAVADLAPELGVLADYGQIVPAALLQLPRHGILNVHPSLLPRHRGATPIQATIAEGDAEAGVTIIRMDEGVDTGPIVASEAWPLDPTVRAPDLEARAARAGAALLERTLDGWLDGTIAARPQRSEEATRTAILRRAGGRLDPERPASELERQVRALAPWPGSYLETSAGRLIVHSASVAPSSSGDVPGTLVAQDGWPALATASGRLVLDEVQLAGRRRMPGAALLRGAPALLEAAVLSGAAEGAGSR